MMALRFPWTARIELAKKEVEKAQRGYETQMAQLPRIEALAAELERHRIENGWTATFKTLFGSRT